MKTMLLPLTLLCVLTGCAEDPHIAEISGLRGIIAQMDIDKSKAAEEMGIVYGDYEQAKRNRDEAWAENQMLRVFALELIKTKGWRVDQIWICRQEFSDAHPDPRPAYIAAEWSTECENSTSFHFVYDAAGTPSFAPEEG